ncbi:MAG: putative DNA-binding domain-containing protein [Taibaiella sp.]|nr:putative DNA-binding domain-containing protein [Taibaiella sp.]
MEALSLEQLQKWMQGNLMYTDPGVQAGVADVVKPSARLSAQAHLDIYKSSYIARLRECLRTQFGALAHALGPQLFEAFTDQYLEGNPSESYTLNDLGKKFPDFLQATRPDADQPEKETWPDFMIELARFEYALSAIFDEHVADEEYATAAGALRPARVLHLFHHSHPVADYYLAYTRKETPELPWPADSYCAVTRRDYRLGIFAIRPAQYHLLSYIKAGHDITTAKQMLAQNFNFTSEQVEAVWPEWERFFVGAGVMG